MRYRDRTEAGRRLARRLEQLRGRDVVVLGLPRGGVPVAYEVATGLGAPLDVLVVRKLGVPWQPELGFGAIGEHGVRVYNEDVIRRTGLTPDDRATVERSERAELERRVRRYRLEREPVPVAGRTAVIVDDGLATGATAEAACRVVRGQGAARVILAVPLGPTATTARLRNVADDVICLQPVHHLGSVGVWYHDFTQVEDDEVTALLARAPSPAPSAAPPGPPDGADGPAAPGRPGRWRESPAAPGQSGAPAASDRRDPPPAFPPFSDRLGARRASASAAPGWRSQPREAPKVSAAGAGRDVEVPAGRVRLGARLVVPDGAPVVVAFAHGSGSSRLSPRNRYVADVLNRAGLGTLLLDLLSEGEERDRHNVFDIRMLAGRLHAAALWLIREKGLPVAYFGASTGAAAALEAAAAPGADITSIVSRGGRPDLATPAALAHVQAPTLLIVGSRDTRVLSLNRLAADWMRCEHRIAVVPGATHLFPEPDALATVAALARDWFTSHLARPPATAAPGRPA